MYELSFATEFFYRNESEDSTDGEPRSLLEAIMNMDADEYVQMTQDVLGWMDTSDFRCGAYAVVDRAREVDSCSNLTSPVEVWLDAQGEWKVDVY